MPNLGKKEVKTVKPTSPEKQDEYVRPELFDLGDAAELTRGGTKGTIDNPNGDTRKPGTPASPPP